MKIVKVCCSLLLATEPVYKQSTVSPLIFELLVPAAGLRDSCQSSYDNYSAPIIEVVLIATALTDATDTPLRPTHRHVNNNNIVITVTRFQDCTCCSSWVLNRMQNRWCVIFGHEATLKLSSAWCREHERIHCGIIQTVHIHKSAQLEWSCFKYVWRLKTIKLAHTRPLMGMVLFNGNSLAFLDSRLPENVSRLMIRA